MKILVTGGAGFIGSAFIRYVIKNTQDTIINVDKLTYAGNLENLREVDQSERYIFEHVDICDRVKLEGLFDLHQPDVLIHLAAESHVDRSIHSSSAFMHTNIIGTYTLLEVARHYWQGLDPVRKMQFRFHHVSTDEVYGDLPHPTDQSDATEYLFSENSSYAPSSPYSASKASSDHLVRAWSRTYDLPILITHTSNNYGPYQFPEKLIPTVILRALKRQEIPVYGQGDQIRDWLYVDDHVRALYIVLTKGHIGQTYNIGGHNEIQNINVVETICGLLQRIQTVEKGYHDLITYVEDRPGHDRRYAINASKIKEQLGWQPNETFESGIEKTVRWYLENLDWCEHAVDRAHNCTLN